MLEKEKVYRNTKNDIKKYSEELEKLKGEWSEYQTKVVEANNTLSDLEKAAKEIAPKEDLIDPKILYPAFAASMIVNLVMGGHILSQVPSTLSQSLNLAGSSSSSSSASSDTSSVASKIQEAASRYEENVIDSGED